MDKISLPADDYDGRFPVKAQIENGLDAGSGDILADHAVATQASPLVVQPVANGTLSSTYSITQVSFPATGGNTVSISAAAGIQNHASVVGTGAGSAVALYFDAPTGQIVGRTLSSTGAVGPVVPLTTTGVQLDTNGAGDDQHVSAAHLANGNIVVTWSANSTIYARIFTPNLTPVSGEIVVGTPDLGFYHEYSPDVTALTNGDFVVAWQDLLAASESHIRVARLTAAGAPVTSFTADAPVNFNDERPSIAGLSDGGYVLGFDRRGNESSPGTHVYAALYNADNSVRAAVAQLDDGSALNRDVEVVARSYGNYSVYYETANGSSDTRIVAMTNFNGGLPSATGYRGSLNTSFSDHGAAGGFDSPNGYSIVTWTDTLSTSSDHDARGALISPTGEILNTNLALTVATYLEQASGVYWLDGGTFAAVYETNHGGQPADTGDAVEMHAFAIQRTTTADGADDVIDFTNDAFINSVSGGGGNDTIYGGIKDDRLFGNDGDDIIRGGAGNDTIGGDAGTNQLYGGPGDDTYYVDTASDKVVENAGEGLDVIYAQLSSYTLPDNVEGLAFYPTTNPRTGIGNQLDNLMDGEQGDDHLFGLAGDDKIAGDTGNDRIDGGTGVDLMVGGAGNDTYVVDNVGDTVVENANEGIDTVESSIDYTLLANFENLTLTGSAGLTATGNTVNNVLIGNSGDNHLFGAGGSDMLIGNGGNDTLDGGAGFDDLYGGTGDDTYFTNVQDDLVFENAGEGTDTVISTSNFYLYANIENLTLATGAGNIFGVGNELANIITGNEGANTILAGAGADIVHGGAGVDIIFAEAGNDQLFGDAGNDFLAGGDGDDVMDGGAGGDSLFGDAGNDTLYGGTTFEFDQLVGGDGNDILHGDSGNADYDNLYGNVGDDSYYVDTGDDLTFEQAGQGTDTVYANVPGANNGVYLYDNIENLVLLGTTRFGVGNTLANTITGNAVTNLLLGGDGNDVINGKGGNDVLFGQGGADTFVFEHGTGGDVIGDFTAGTDKIDLRAIGYTWTQVQNSFHQNGSDLAIDLGNGDLIVLQGVNVTQLHQSDFILGAAAAVVPIELSEMPADPSMGFGARDGHWMTIAEL